VGFAKSATEGAAPLTFGPFAAAEILDQAALDLRLAQALSAAPDARAMRGGLVGVLKAALTDGRARLEAIYRAHPRDARDFTAANSWLTDCIVTTALQAVQTRMHPNPNPSDGERIATLAVGGYGRAEMAPHSDIDLLFLVPWKVTGWVEQVIESTLYVLWDLKLKVGHASRSIDECLRLGKEDITIRTALLEHRFLHGNAALAHTLRTRLWSELFAKTHADFVEAKLAERDARLSKIGNQRYLLEPNVKEGKGGLRDLQTLYWIAKYIHEVDQARELVGLGFFRPEEYEAFREAETFLWAVRCHMHHIAGRAVEQLTFDIQVGVADCMGYKDHGGRRGVEHFMQDYFRNATRVGELTRIFLTELEARHVKREPLLRNFLNRRKKMRHSLRVVQNRLDIEDEAAFLSDPLNMLRILKKRWSQAT